MQGMQLDRATGTQRLTLSSRALQTTPGNGGCWLCVDSVSNYSKRDKRFETDTAISLITTRNTNYFCGYLSQTKIVAYDAQVLLLKCR
jgi:hypothetical protein